MEGKGNISDYRSKLEKTLASPDLTNEEKLQTLVRNQILQSSSHLQLEGYIENVVERRSTEVSNLLSMLRSASVNDIESSKSGTEGSHGGWKVKEETEEFRVMYREGAEGTPFHTLLVEGYVDGPLDVCLCISWETGLYNKWWPQTSIPTFKIISSRCLKTVRPGEQMSLVRMKVSWPLSSREAVLHYFAFEYFQDDLMVVLLNSISDSEIIDRCTHGFTRDGVPNAEEVVRIDVVGGFAFQKATADRSYFRAIANMDVKLDFVPPSFINFISRQLLGSGFKLFKKEVASVSKGDENFREALKDPFYTRIREGLYSGNSTRSQDLENLKRSISVMLDDKKGGAFEDDNAKENNCCNDRFIDSEARDVMLRDTSEIHEVEELKEKHETLDNCTLKSSEMKATESYATEVGKKVTISSEVEEALETLEKAISVFRVYTSNSGKGHSGINSTNLTNVEKGAVEESTTSEGDQMSRSCAESLKTGSLILSSVEPRISLDNHDSRQKGSNSCMEESPNKDSSTPSHNSNHISLLSPMNQKTGSTLFVNNTFENDLACDDAKTTKGKRNNKRSRFWCMPFIHE